MFTPTLSREQRRQVSDLRTRLAKALEPNAIEDSPKLAPLVTKREELTVEIGEIEGRTGTADLEKSAELITNRRGQLHLIGLQIKELNEAREKAKELAQKKWTEALDALSFEARTLLAEIAESFQKQHREALEKAIGQYATNHSAQARNLIGFLPWFLQYLKNIRAFREHGAEPARLLNWLDEALAAGDFLMRPKS